MEPFNSGAQPQSPEEQGDESKRWTMSMEQFQLILDRKENGWHTVVKEFKDRYKIDIKAEALQMRFYRLQPRVTEYQQLKSAIAYLDDIQEKTREIMLMEMKYAIQAYDEGRWQTIATILEDNAKAGGAELKQRWTVAHVGKVSRMWENN